MMMATPWERAAVSLCVTPSRWPKSDGTPSTTTASTSIEAFTPTLRASNDMAPLRSPPSRMDAPSTSRMLPTTEPMIEARATSIRPSRTVSTTMISSGRLPNVAFSSDARRGPEAVPGLLGRLAEDVRERHDG